MRKILLIVWMLFVFVALASAQSLTFSTYLGGAAEDTARDVAIDAAGNIFIIGGTASPTFPVTAGSFDTSFNGIHDIWVAKLDPSGSILWCTFLGGPNYDRAYAIELAPDGSLYLAGRAGAGFPVTSGAIQTTFAGDAAPSPVYGPEDAFVARLSADGKQLLAATYFSGSGGDVIRDVCVDGQGFPYIGMSAAESNPHVTSDALQPNKKGASDTVLAKLNPNLTAIIYCTYLGGSNMDGGTPSVKVDAQGQLHALIGSKSTDLPVTPGAHKTTNSSPSLGEQAIAKLATDGKSLIYLTYTGGNNNDFSETHGLVLDGQGFAYVAYTTKSTGLPSSGYQKTYGGTGGSGTGTNTNYPGDVWIGKYSLDGKQLLASTYLGGRYGEGAEGISIDGQGRIVVSGATYSDNFPVSADGAQKIKSGKADQFISVLSADLTTLIYSSYRGGSDDDLSRGSWSGVSSWIFVGQSKSPNWPKTGGQSFAGNFDATVTIMSLPIPLPPVPANFAATAVSSSQIDLAWLLAAGADGYKVERSADGQTGWTEIAALPADRDSYQDQGLTAGTAYFYRVRAFNAGGDGPYSATATASTQAGSGGGGGAPLPIVDCALTMAVTSQDFAATGGMGAIFINSNCAYAVMPSASWIQSKVGCGGTIIYEILPNPQPGTLRAGTLTIIATSATSEVGKVFTVRQQ